ncbi:hypothetical protein [Thermoactinospora rubra]|uniref:hypothetical protein n=1 Tax=Thermoactinospora rubra TaxID=1088767 RepID=UPI000A121384|nr:hypothetical protein [Thermoactinospora rubra]
MTKPGTHLTEVLRRAGMNPRQLAAAVNARLEARGLSARRIDPTAPYSWVRLGYKPYDPLPEVVAAVLSEHLGRPISVEQLWPHAEGVGTVVGAVSGLAHCTNAEDVVAALSELTLSSASLHGEVSAATGPDLAAAVLDGIATVVSLTRRNTNRDRVLPAQVALIASHVAALRRLDDRHGGGVLSLRYVTSELRNVLDLVRSADYDATVGPELMAIVADLAQLVGWVHFDAHRYGAAERYLLLSARVARALEDRGRMANTVGMLVYISAFAGHGSQAVNIAEAAAEICPSDPALRARISGRVATAAAAAGDQRGFQAASEEARELLRQAREAPSYLYYLEPEQLAAEAGQALVVLAEQATVYRKALLREAVALLAPISAAGQRPDYPRSALLHGAFLTRAYLLQGELEAAVSAAREAITRLTQVQSLRGIACLRQLRPAFARRSRSPVVSEFLPEFDMALSPT